MAVEFVHFVALLVLKRVVRGTMRRLPFTLSPSEPLSSTDPGSFSRSSFTRALALNKGFGSSYLPFFHTSCLSHSRLPHSHARFFHLSAHCEGASCFLSASRNQLFIKAAMTDYAIVLDKLQNMKKKLEEKEKEQKKLEKQETEQKKPDLDIKSHYLIKFFRLTPTGPPRTQNDGPRLECQEVIDEKNDDLHASYDDEEFRLLIEICQSPEGLEYLEAKGKSVAYVEKQVEDLKNIRKEFREKYDLKATGPGKKNKNENFNTKPSSAKED